MLQHTSVLLEEAVEALNPRPGKTYVDGTLGGGGHARRLCERLESSNLLIGVDQDPVALAKAEQHLADCPTPKRLIRGNFGNLYTLLLEHGYASVDGGVLLDLGMSDFQIKVPERGFSFQHAAPLDMRMDPAQPTTAADLVNTLPASALANLFFQNADEKLSRQLAAAIIAERPIRDTRHLAHIAEAVYRKKGVKAQNIHPATRIFQALRMAVNEEMPMLAQFLEQLPKILKPGARAALITFHSGEDRLVKTYFRTASAACLCPPRQPICTCAHVPTFKVIGKPITASPEELTRNPQARSAKLRVAERL